MGSRYNPRLSIIDNIQLPPTLLSRFDLIYLVLDKADEASDRKLARHLVAMYHATPPANAQVLASSQLQMFAGLRHCPNRRSCIAAGSMVQAASRSFHLQQCIRQQYGWHVRSKAPAPPVGL